LQLGRVPPAADKARVDVLVRFSGAEQVAQQPGHATPAPYLADHGIFLNTASAAASSLPTSRMQTAAYRRRVSGSSPVACSTVTAWLRFTPIFLTCSLARINSPSTARSGQTIAPTSPRAAARAAVAAYAPRD